MSLQKVTKHTIICDTPRCKEKCTITFSLPNPRHIYHMSPSFYFKEMGWLADGKGKHFCPKCKVALRVKKLADKRKDK